jgi:hypothetical protein
MTREAAERIRGILKANIIDWPNASDECFADVETCLRAYLSLLANPAARVGEAGSRIDILEQTLRMSIKVAREAYESTGYFKVSKTSAEQVVVDAALNDFRCPHCDCRSFARPDELKPDGSFGPGLDVLCVGCKYTFSATKGAK